MTNLNPAALGPLYEAATIALSLLEVNHEAWKIRADGPAFDKLRSSLTLAEAPAPVGAKRWKILLCEDDDGDPIIDEIESSEGSYVLFTDYSTLAAQLAGATEAVQWLVRSAACLHNFNQAEDGDDRQWYRDECNRALAECRKFEIVRKAMETYIPAALSRAAALGVKP